MTVMDDACIQCRRTADDLGHGAVLMTRQRPLVRGTSTYQVCIECARKIRVEQDARAQEAIKEAERSGV